jgi:RHS repeat-associated protein
MFFVSSSAQPSVRRGRGTRAKWERRRRGSRARIALVALLALLASLTPAVVVPAAAESTPVGGPLGDIVFLIDESGSMGDDHAEVRSRINDIITQLSAEGVDAQLGLIGYDGSPRVYSPLTKDMSAFRTALTRLRLLGGTEAGFRAVDRAMQDDMGWRDGSGRCAILIADEDSDVPGGTPTRAQATAALQARSAVFFGIVEPTAGTTRTDYGPNPGSLAEATGGSVFPIRDFRRDPAPVIDAVVSQCINVIKEVAQPDADAGPDTSVVEGSLVTLDGTASTDPDGDPLAYSWQLAGHSGPPITLSSATSATPSFRTFDDGEYRFLLTVTDGTGSSSDEVVVSVTNGAPTLQVSADPAYAGGAALITASFTDPAALDTHSATVSWGDGSAPETVPVTAQGTGWGSLFASHVYATPGARTITVSVTDDDGGQASGVTEGFEVVEPVALWANTTTDDGSFEWTSGAVTVEGLTHSNADLRIRGAAKTFRGTTQYVGALDVGGTGTTFTPAPTRVAPQPYPITYDLADYRPGGRAAREAGSAYHDVSAACGTDGTWHADGASLPSGIYYTSCAAKLNGHPMGGTITLVAEREIQISGSGAVFDPFVDGLLFLSGSSSSRAVQISTASSRFLGYTFAGVGGVDLAGAGNQVYCGVLADRIDISARDLRVRGSGCTRPARTEAPPTLVPSLQLGLAADRADVLPAQELTHTATVRNAGALLLVPGLVGVENLGDAPATVVGHDLRLEAQGADGTWAPVPGEVSLTVRGNPAPGVALPAGGDPVDGTTVAARSFATWGFSAQVLLDADQVTALLDPVRTLAVRVSSSFDTSPSTVPVRRLFRYGNDLGPQLRTASGDLHDVAVDVITPDGAVQGFSPTTTPALTRLAPGGTAELVATSDVEGPAARGTEEEPAAYLARLATFDGTLLHAAAAGTARAGVGTLLAPQQLARSTRTLPVVRLEATGPAAVEAGSEAAFTLTTANEGSARATGLSATASLAGVGTLPVTGVPTTLEPGTISAGAAVHAVPATASQALALTGSLTWGDEAGNTYGPVTDAFSSKVVADRKLEVAVTDDLTRDADGTERIRYQATVTNVGDKPVTSVVLTQAPDPYTALVVGSVDASQGTVTAGNGADSTSVSVQLGTIGSRSNAVVGFEVTVRRPLPDGVSSVTTQGSATSAELPAVLSDDPNLPGVADPTTTPVHAEPGGSGGSDGGYSGGEDGGGNGLPGPVAGALTPADGATVTGPVTLSTTLTAPEGETVVSWRVLYRAAGSTTQTELASGTGPLVEAAFDPTVLPNGTYLITVAGTASGGGTSASASSLVVDGDLKLGRYRTSVLDLDAAVGGLPLQLTRTYDSFEPAVGDFGHGWRAELSSFSVSTNRPLGYQGWSQESRGCSLIFCTIGYRTSAPHFVTVTWPGGNQEVFDLVPKDGSTFFRPLTSAAFVGRPGTTSTLEADGDSSLTYLDDGNLYGGAFGTGGVYDPKRFRLTARDGTVYVLDRSTGMVSATDRTGGTITVSRDGVRSSTGASLLLTRDDAGRITKAVGPGGAAVLYGYDAAGDLTSVTDPGGRVTRYVYDGSHDLVRAEGAGGVVLGIVEYDADGRMVAVVDGAGNRTEVTSDVGARQEVVHDATGRLTQVFSYDEDGDLLREQRLHDGQDRSWSWTYDALGRPTSETDPRGTVTSATWTARGDLASYTDPEGRTWRYEHDSTGRPVRQIAPDGRVTMSVTYDDRGLLVAQQQSDGVPWTFAYDTGGRLTELRRDGVLTQTRAYDSLGRVTSVTQPGRPTRAFGYDTAGRVTSVKEGTAPATTMEFDGSGNLTRAVDPAGRAQSFEYDALGRRSAAVDGASRRTTYTYDGASRLATVRDRTSTITSYEYDGNGRVTKEVVGASARSFDYDGAGRLTRLADATSEVAFGYDEVDDLVSQTTTGAPGSGLPTTALTFAYDGTGTPTATTGPGGTTSFGYDQHGRLDEVTDAAGGTFSLGFDDADRLTSLTRPNGVTDALAWDRASGELASRVSTDAAGTTLAKAEYGYDAAGRRTSLTDLEGVHASSYDALGQLTGADHPAGSPVADESYTYDAGGNRTSWAGTAPGQAVYDASHRLTRDGQYDYAYDGEGRLTRRTERSTARVTTYTWTSRGQLATVRTPDGVTSTYTYDPLGRRIQVSDGTTVRKYAWDGSNPVAEYDAGNALVATHTATPDAGLVLGSTRGGTASYQLQDGLGSTVATTDSSGAVTGRTSWNAFGVPSGPVADSTFGYTGHQWDSATGLHYARARSYDPSLGRFTSEDPVPSLNPYVYVRNDPCNLVDPSGAAAAGEYGLLARNSSRQAAFYHEVGNFICGQLVGAALGLMDGPNGMGKAGEDFFSKLSGLDKNTRGIEVGGRGRIPDFINGSGDFFEVKNTATQSFTRQLRDMVMGRESGEPLTLVTRGTTKLSGPLIQAIKSGSVRVLACLPG